MGQIKHKAQIKTTNKDLNKEWKNEITVMFLHWHTSYIVKTKCIRLIMNQYINKMGDNYLKQISNIKLKNNIKTITYY